MYYFGNLVFFIHCVGIVRWPVYIENYSSHYDHPYHYYAGALVVFDYSLKIIRQEYCSDGKTSNLPQTSSHSFSLTVFCFNKLVGLKTVWTWIIEILLYASNFNILVFLGSVLFVSLCSI